MFREMKTLERKGFAAVTLSIVYIQELSGGRTGSHCAYRFKAL